MKSFRALLSLLVLASLVVLTGPVARAEDPGTDLDTLLQNPGMDEATAEALA